MSMRKIERDPDQLGHLRTALGVMFNKADELTRKGLDPVMYIFQVTRSGLLNDGCAARSIKDIGVRILKSAKAGLLALKLSFRARQYKRGSNNDLRSNGVEICPPFDRRYAHSRYW